MGGRGLLGWKGGFSASGGWVGVVEMGRWVG